MEWDVGELEVEARSLELDIEATTREVDELEETFRETVAQAADTEQGAERTRLKQEAHATKRRFEHRKTERKHSLRQLVAVRYLTAEKGYLADADESSLSDFDPAGQRQFRRGVAEELRATLDIKAYRRMVERDSEAEEFDGGSAAEFRDFAPDPIEVAQRGDEGLDAVRFEIVRDALGTELADALDIP